MYLYETYNDPIQMISGDAYADIGAVKPNPLNLVKKKEPKPKPPKSDPPEYETIRTYLVTMGMNWVMKKIGWSHNRVRYHVIKMGFRFIGHRSNGHWEAPKEKKADIPPSIDKIFELYLVNKGMAYVAQQASLLQGKVRHRAYKLGYRFVGNRRWGYWEMPGKEVSESAKRRCELFPEADEIIRRYIVSRGCEWTARKIGMSSPGTRKRAHKLGYSFIGITNTGHWEAPKEEGNY